MHFTAVTHQAVKNCCGKSQDETENVTAMKEKYAVQTMVISQNFNKGALGTTTAIIWV